MWAREWLSSTATQSFAALFLIVSVQQVWASDSISLKTLTSYSDTYSDTYGLAYKDPKDSTLFHVYIAAQPDISMSKSLAETPWVYTKIDVKYKNGNLIPGKEITLSENQLPDEYSNSNIEDQRVAIIDKIYNGTKVYKLINDLKIDSATSVDVTIERYKNDVISHLIVHYKEKTITRDFKYSWIRDVMPMPARHGQNDIGVISDGCGAAMRTSTIDVIRVTR